MFPSFFCALVIPSCPDDKYCEKYVHANMELVVVVVAVVVDDSTLYMQIYIVSSQLRLWMKFDRLTI